MNANEQERIMKQNDKDYDDWVCVVRCKDCIYREEYKIFGKPTAYYCSRGCVDSNLSLNENEYCCWGERKEAE